MVHFAISAMLVWLAINIAFVLARLRSIEAPHAAPDLRKRSSPHFATLPLHQRLDRGHGPRVSPNAHGRMSPQ